MREAPPWRPLLQGGEREQALHVVRSVAEALEAHARSSSLKVGLTGGAAGLTGGSAGLALFFAYLHRVEPSVRHEDVSERLLQASMEAVSSQPMSAALSSGFTGVAWVVEHLQNSGHEVEEDALLEIDEALLQLLETPPWSGTHDLISGLAGLGVYALERLPRPSAVQCLERVVARLAETAQTLPEGIAWWTQGPFLPAWRRARSSQPVCDLGVAHGVPGIMGVLAGAVSAGVSAEESRRLLRGAWDYLWAHRMPYPGARIPDAVAPDLTPRPTRSGWCYGDPGVSLVLHGVARTLGDSQREEAALALACEAAHRPLEETRVADAGLCHGSAGLAHIYNRLYQATGRSELAAAARQWLDHTLGLWQPGQGIGGYRVQNAREDGELFWDVSPGLLAGEAGTALALLAAASPVEPAWDRSLLMSLRPPERAQSSMTSR